MIKRRLIEQPRMSWLPLVLVFASGSAIAQTGGSLPSAVLQFADYIYVNGHVVTLDNHEMNADPGSIVEAIAVRDEVIIGLGSNEDIRSMAGPETRVFDLQGKTVLPGIVESHVHPMSDSERFARERYHLRNTPEGYVLKMDIAATPDDTMLKVARAMDLLLSVATPTPDEWLNIEILHSPELGFATPASVSTLVSAPRLADVQISKSDITEIVPNYPLVLSSATRIMDAPRPNVWFHVTVGADGQPVTEEVVALEGGIEQ